MANPYLEDPQRLADVIAAIQVMGAYKFYKLSFSAWAERIVADESQAEHWHAVFNEHPEFFRLDTEREKASLVWRRQYPRRYHVDQEHRISLEEFEKLTDAEKKRVSRDPLTAEDIKALIDAAIKLHASAVASEQEKRWWIALVSSAIGGLIGALIGALFRRG